MLEMLSSVTCKAMVHTCTEICNLQHSSRAKRANYGRKDSKQSSTSAATNCSLLFALLTPLASNVPWMSTLPHAAPQVSPVHNCYTMA